MQRRSPAIPLAPQSIMIDTPSRLTLVGSPIVITGRTGRLPQGGQLNYRFVDRNGQELGVGDLARERCRRSARQLQRLAELQPAAGWRHHPRRDLRARQRSRRGRRRQRARPGGGRAVPEHHDRHAAARHAGGQPDGADGAGRRGGPTLAASATGSSTAPTSSSARATSRSAARRARRAASTPSCTLILPINGDTIRAEIFDESIATNAISLYVAPLPQQIAIDTPPPGTLVGSPMVFTGRTTRPPVRQRPELPRDQRR